MLKKIDSFGKNIIVVFAGTSLANVINLVCQLLIAHRLSAVDFAVFNSLLAVYVIIGAPFSTLQAVTTKYISEFNARSEHEKLKALFSGLLKALSVISLIVFGVTCLTAPLLSEKLKVPGLLPFYLVAALLALTCILPIFSGAVQGLERFKLLSITSVAGALIKLGLLLCFLGLGYGISGALAAFLAAAAAGILLVYPILKDYIAFRVPHPKIDFHGFSAYLFPVALSYFCFMVLVSADMVMVKYYFSQEKAGVYSLAQVTGKIFLFFPGAISMVMYPRTSHLHAKNLDTSATLKRSIFYAAGLCGIAAMFYNIWPYFSLSVLTGKAIEESVFLGRMFSFSMTFFALSWILLFYFISKKDLRFVGWLAGLTIFELVGIVLFHSSLFQVQSVLCAIAFIFFCVNMALFFNPQTGTK